MYDWIHIIDSEETYKKLWEIIGKYRELYLGMFIVIDGLLTCKDGRSFGKKRELTAAIITSTFNRDTMESMINSGIIDSSKVALFDDLNPEEVDPESEYTSGIKKEIKNFEGPTAFKNYLRSIHYKDFKFEE